MLDILKLFHVLLAIGAMGLAIPAATRIVAGRLFERTIVLFLQFSLAASATGLLLSLHHATPTRWLTVFGVYMSGIAVLAWRKFALAGNWALVFALSTMGVLCLDTLVVVAHIFNLLADFGILASPLPAPLVPVAAPVVVLFFAMLSIRAAKRIPHASTCSIMHKVTR